MPYLKPATDAPFGFLPATEPLRIQQYVMNTNATVFAGDPARILATGLVDRMNDNATGPMIGVFAETILSASAGTKVSVYDHPDQQFVCQDDDVGTAIAQTHFGNVFAMTGFIPTAAADLARGRSIAQVDTSTVTTTTNSLPFQFIMLHPIETGGFPSAAGSPRKIIVKISPQFHFYASNSAVI